MMFRKIAVLATLPCFLFTACGPTNTTRDTTVTADVVDTSDEAPDAFDAAITDVNQTPVKRQSIGNCWLYATASWAESLHKTATNGEELNLSETYWTYWHWFDQIARGYVGTQVQTGGSFDTAREIIRSYGSIAEAEFVPEEATLELSSRQASALAAINASLATGALSVRSARTRANVRAELDKAFGLRPEAIAWMDQVFGKSVSRTLRTTSTSVAGTPIKKTTQIKAWYKNTAGTVVTTTLRTALNQFNEAYYPSSETSRRTFWKRVQKAMHDGQPLILTWFVDFNSMNAGGEFLDKPATPGRQGGHMVVVEDYEVDNVPGFGTLPAGVTETRPEALAASLSNEATIKFLRIKNSWGTARGGPENFAGYHDLHLPYLNGPIAQCRVVNGSSDPTDCPWNTVPLTAVAFPAGY